MASVPATCPVCDTPVVVSPGRDVAAALASHLVEEAARSDEAHVMWLNRTISSRRVGEAELAALLTEWAATGTTHAERVGRRS